MRGGRSHLRRASIRALPLIALCTCLAPPLTAQSNIKTYYVNDGRSNVRESAAAELQIDIGGFIPYSRYSENASGGHAYAVPYDAGSWPPGLPTTFRALMKAYGLDLYELDAKLDATVTTPSSGLPTVLPFGSRVEVDPELLAYNALPVPDLPFPVEFDAWWSVQSSGVPGAAGKRKVLMWPYRINGGAMMICMASNGNREIARREPAEESSIVLVNYSFHWRHLGTNRNRWRDGGVEWPRQFSGAASGPFMTQDGGRLSNGTEILGLQEQAIEDGDVVVYVGENIGNNLWISLQRTQEAEAYVRGEWSLAPPGDPASYAPVPIARTHLDGRSWGQAMSATLCFLQPAIYSGTAAWNISDFRYAQGDHYDMQGDRSAALGHAGWLLGTEPIWTTQWALIDALGIRFDDAKLGQQPWDLAAISMNRRPSGLQVPVYGVLGDNEFNWPMHWPSEDAAAGGFGANGSLATTFVKNWEHDPVSGFIPTVNEFAMWTGSEWSALEAAGVATAAANPDLVPTAVAPPKPYPDPYSHTLRHVHADPSPNHPILTQVDAAEGLTPSYRVQAPGPNANLNTIGQGSWIGYKDTMHALDLDGDGNIEVVFGNFEGYVHVLEFNPAADPTDPYRLYDEWKSPYLGRGIVSSDCVFGAGLAQMFFGTSNGDVFRIDAKSANTYQVENNGQPVVSAVASGGGNAAYAGTTPIVLVADLAGTPSTRELLVVNRFLDWNLYTFNGTLHPGGKLFRPMHAIGPTDAFPAPQPMSSDSNRELLVAASDGHVWWFDYDANGAASGAVQWLPPMPALPYTGLSLFKVVPIFAAGPSAPPSHLLLFGRNDDRDEDADFDGFPDGNPDAIQLWNLSPPALIQEIAPGLVSDFDGFDTNMSFAWVNKPGSQTLGAGKFAIATGATIQVYDVNPQGANKLNAAGSRQIYFPVSADQAKSTSCILSLDVAPLKPSAGGQPASCFVFTDCGGRVYVLDQDLEFLRFSNIDFFGATFPANQSWAERASNLTLAGNYAFSGEDHVPADGGGRLYVADYAAPALRKGGGTGTPIYPVYGLRRIPAVGHSWERFLSPIGVPTTTILEAKNEASFDVLRRNFNRTLIYQDLDGLNGRDLEILAETGVAYHDAAEGKVRRFQTSSYRTPASSAALYLEGFYGGRVYEHPIRGDLHDYDHLGDFIIPVDPLHTNFGSPANDGWWFPTVDSAVFMSGQIESHWQSATAQGLGTSMKTAMLRTGGTGPIERHIVTGTNGGFVYAIRPGTPPTTGDMVDSVLSWSSPDLGSFIIGLDCADLNGDGVDEIVCGCSIDDGTYQDWLAGQGDKNRGKRYVIDTTLPPVVGPGLGIEPLTGDSSFPPPNAGKGIGASVFGVRIDDVNNDDTKEIWCTDQLHVYLFFKDATSGTWKVATRSPDLGCFPGLYNSLFPLKDEFGKTVRLIVVSTGYVMEFAVDPEAVP